MKSVILAVAVLLGAAGRAPGQAVPLPARPPKPGVGAAADVSIVPGPALELPTVQLGASPSAAAVPAPASPWTPPTPNPGSGSAPGGGTCSSAAAADGGEGWEDMPAVLAEALEQAFPCRPGRTLVWGGVEALGWWEKRQPLPADLVTTGLPTDARPGALGQRNTLVVPVAGAVDDGILGGVRLFGGVWLDPHGVIGLDAGGFVLEERGATFGITSTPGGNPLLALRHLDPPGAPGNVFTPAAPSALGGTGRPAAGREDAFAIAEPAFAGGTAGPVAGAIRIHTDSQLWGSDVNVLHAFSWSPDFHLVGLAGLRYLDLDEDLDIQTQRTVRGTGAVAFRGHPVGAPTTELTDDGFRSHNEFYGGQVGVRGEYYCNHFFLGATAKVALGRTEEVADVVGVSTLQRPLAAVLGVPGVPLGPAAPRLVPGGLYALPTNGGHFVNPEFGAVPELQLQAGVLLTRWMRATVGYDVLYWSRVFRPGDQVDLSVNRQQVPTDPAFKAVPLATSPRPLANPSDFWAQGLTLGLEFNF